MNGKYGVSDHTEARRTLIRFLISEIRLYKHPGTSHKAYMMEMKIVHSIPHPIRTPIQYSTSNPASSTSSSNDAFPHHVT